mgnify:CR=1 FL=1
MADKMENKANVDAVPTSIPTTPTGGTAGEGDPSVVLEGQAQLQRQQQQQQVLDHLTRVEDELQGVLQAHQHGRYGFLTREWGFMCPGGLGATLGGKFMPWEDKLKQVNTFFWPLEAYDFMETKHNAPASAAALLASLPKTGEQLYGNTPLHEFLQEPPSPAVQVTDEDLQDYRTAAKIFLLIGTLSHLYGNSALDASKVCLPQWIEEPLLQAAKRLDVEPTLSGHFLVQENWIWTQQPSQLLVSQHPLQVESDSPKNNDHDHTNKKSAQEQFDHNIVQTLLQHCQIDDRRFRVKIYPNCFIGSQAIDVLLEFASIPSREEAVRVGRRVNQTYQLFHHVTDDHLLMDKYLFYRFRPKWQKLLLQLQHQEKSSINVDQTESTMVDGDKIEDIICPASRLMRPSDFFKSSAQGRKSKQKSKADHPSQTQQQQIAASVSESSDKSTTPTGKRRIVDLLFRRSSSETTDNDYALDNVLEHGNSQDAISLASSADCWTNAQLELNDNTMDENDEGAIQEIMTVLAVMDMIKVKDRKYHFRTYKKCWIGRQMIDLLVKQECASSRKDALQLCLDINQRFHIFDHVCGHHPIKDDHLFYRFHPNFKKMMWQQTNGSDGNSSCPDMDESQTSNSVYRVDSPSKTTQPMVDESLRAKLRREPGALTLSQTAQLMIDENLRSNLTREPGALALSQTGTNFDTLLGLDDASNDEFRFDNIEMLYPAFGHNHEKVNQLIPTCMGRALAGLPFCVLDIISTMRNMLEAEMNFDDASSTDSYESCRLHDLLYKVAFSVSRCKEQFQLMSTDPTKRTFNSKHISIRQTQPMSNGVVVQGKRRKGTTGTQFPYFHLLDWLLGRHQFKDDSDDLVAQIAAIDESYPRPQRDFIEALSKLDKSATLRGFLDLLGRPPELLAAYNHLVECYAGEGGLLRAHCRKLYSYIHNDVQFSTSGTTHLESSGESTPISKAANNHNFAKMMFKHMQKAAEDRWVLRMPPLMTKVTKAVYSTSESGGFTTVALDLLGSGLQYEYGDIVKVLLPNSDRSAYAWIISLASNNQTHFTLREIQNLHRNTGNGWGWEELWEALGWHSFEEGDGKGVPLETICQYIEQGQVQDENNTSTRWVQSPIDLSVGQRQKLFPVPPPLALDKIVSLEPVSPRVYSVSGVEVDRVFLLVSKPQEGARHHHGYERMCDPQIVNVHCSFSPATFFLVPPRDATVVCIASGTGISPFVGLADAIGSRRGSYTIAHQCKSSDLFLANSQTWLDFTAVNPGAVVFGFISGDKSRRNCPMRYIIRNGCFEETTVLRRHNASAYYFECTFFQDRIQETYQNGGLNLAYCCGGVKSAIEPLKDMARKHGMTFEFTCECYGVPPTLSKDDGAVSQIGGSIVSLDHVSPIHPGGDQILHQIHEVALETQQPTSTPDLSITFWELHPHAYNLWRCLRTPMDGDSEEFAAFLERQSVSKSVMKNMAVKYAEVALASPDNSKVVRIAAELQCKVIRQQLALGDADGAKVASSYLEALLVHVSPNDPSADRWKECLKSYFKSAATS